MFAITYTNKQGISFYERYMGNNEIITFDSESEAKEYIQVFGLVDVKIVPITPTENQTRFKELLQNSKSFKCAYDMYCFARNIRK